MTGVEVVDRSGDSGGQGRWRGEVRWWTGVATLVDREGGGVRWWTEAAVVEK
jgi:hypothetical protein